MQRHPPEPLIVHPLPHSPEFVGREREQDDLRSGWMSESGGVVALVGLGGAGKTSLATRFLDELLDPGCPARPDGLFVWSFYQQPDAALFLQEARAYFAGAGPVAAAPPARGAALLHLLRQALSQGGRHLLVLDGLERVQQQGGGGAGGDGRIEDPLLRGLLSRIAEGTGRATALVTSRFPLTDLEPYRGRGYLPLNVGGLGKEAAIDLLRRRGVVGDNQALAELVENYGAHALTVDHLGGLIGQFLSGDPHRAPEAPALTSPAADRQALRLARLLRAYEEHLPPAELALLCRLCLVRNSVSEVQLLRLFLAAPAVHSRASREAAELLPRLVDPEPPPGPMTRYVDEPLDLAFAACNAIDELLVAAPIAGPADDFPAELRSAVGAALALHDECGREDLEGFVHLYTGTSLDPPTERRPLPAADRERIRDLGKLQRELRDHPLFPKPTMHHAALLQAFQKLGWDPTSRPAPDDRSPGDLQLSLERVERRLHRLHRKHIVLQRVREVCRFRQRKWALSGPLATLDAPAMFRAVAALADRHLVIREADGSVGIHPAVRDHFARLGDESGRGTWHDLIREQLVSLVRRPGRGLPEDKATLDLVEEAIHHTLEAGQVDEAWRLYDQSLGGLRHLGWKLGEMARGLRVLRGFRDCPDRSALGWFLRALGELDEAYLANNLPYFRADLRLLQGRLPEVAAEGDTVRAATASFLMGRSTSSLPPDLLGLSVPRVQLLLLLGRLRQAWEQPRLDRLYKDIGWEGDRLASQLLLAEVARRQSEMDLCQRSLEAASGWILRSGSVEHLCLWHLLRTRLARDVGHLDEARRAVDEGVHLARQGGLGLYHILLLNARAEIVLPTDLALAASSAGEALRLALATNCQFRWGGSEAGHLLGQALAAQGRSPEARAVFEETLALRQYIGDPGAEQTRRLLEALPS